MAVTEKFAGDLVKFSSEGRVIWTGTVRCIAGDSAQTVYTGLARADMVLTGVESAVDIASSGITAIHVMSTQTTNPGEFTIRVRGTGVAGSHLVNMLAIGQGSYT